MPRAASAAVVVLHTTNAPDPDLAESAMRNIHTALDADGATDDLISSFEQTSDPFVFTQWFHDPEPTIAHITATTASGAVTTDWIPLRGLIFSL